MHILPRNVLPATLPLPWAGRAGATGTRVLPRPTGEEKEWEKEDGGEEGWWEQATWGKNYGACGTRATAEAVRAARLSLI